MDPSHMMTPPGTPTPAPQPTISRAPTATAATASNAHTGSRKIAAEHLYACARKHRMPTNPQTLADFRFDKCLFAADKTTLLRIYGILVTTFSASAHELREWAAEGPKSLARNIWVELSTNAKLVPREYLRFVVDNQQIWDLENELRLDSESGSEADEEDGQESDEETIIRAKETKKRFLTRKKRWVPLHMRKGKSGKDGEKRKRDDSSDEGAPKPSSKKAKSISF